MHFLSFFFLFVIARAANVVDYSDGIYDQLYRAANLTSVAYCVGPFTPDFIQVGKTFNCELEFCEQNQYRYEIVDLFQPSDSLFEFGISGTGYIAVGHETKEIIVAYRGSLSIEDAITDISLDLVDWTSITTGQTCDGCKVHRGFYEALNTGFKLSLDIIQDLKANYSDYLVFVTGHSLGGAMANLAGIEFSLLGYNPLVISMAGPKVGNVELADFTNSLFGTDELDAQFRSGSIDLLTSGFWRVIEKDDYVPVVPPGEIYAHAGLEFAIQDPKPLPQPKSSVPYSGKYKYESLLEALDWNDVIAIDIVHVYQHLHYFTNQGTCMEDLLKYIGIDISDQL